MKLRVVVYGDKRINGREKKIQDDPNRGLSLSCYAERKGKGAFGGWGVE